MIAPADLLRVLVVDDEAPARAELSYLLQRDARVGTTLAAADGAEALRLMADTALDAVFLDIRMPGLTGLDLAQVIRRYASPPAVVFVTAYDDHAVDAFDVRALDYLLKPVRADRLAEAVTRVLAGRRRDSPPPTPLGDLSPAAQTASATSEAATATDDGADQPDTASMGPVEDETIAVELGGVTRFVRRSDVRYVEAHGDYARLVTRDGRHLVRVPLTVLEERWGAAGFVRIHRRWLVSLAAIEEVRIEGGRMSLVVGTAMLEVSRRHTRELRDRLVRSARPRR